MFDMVEFKEVKLLEKRDERVLCQVGAKTVEVPIEVLWDEGDELPAVGESFTLRLPRRFAKRIGLTQ